jgi:hypothetical protein
MKVKFLNTFVFILGAALAACSGSPVGEEPQHITKIDRKDIRSHFMIETGSDGPDSLANPFPNPYNHTEGDTTIHINFNLADSADLKILIQNPIGDSVVVFEDTRLGPGAYSGSWLPLSVDNQPLRPGLYFITMRADPNKRNYIQSKLIFIENND